jgi:hypothetical protein
MMYGRYDDGGYDDGVMIVLYEGEGRYDNSREMRYD